MRDPDRYLPDPGLEPAEECETCHREVCRCDEYESPDEREEREAWEVRLPL